MKLFYSWQKSTNTKANFSFIDRAIRDACEKIKEDNPNNIIIPDRDTKDRAGAISIIDSILEKICEADVLVFDISIINSHSEEEKKCINPNVAFELGFAVAERTWERIILVFNEACGDIKSDIPFDLLGHRILPYKFDGKNNRTEEFNKLISGLKDAISIIINNPKPNIIDSQKETRKLQDENLIKQFFEKFSISEFDKFVEDIRKQRRSSDNILKYYTEVYNLVNSSNYFFYNKRLEKLTKDFVKELESIFENLDEFFYNFADKLEINKYSYPPVDIDYVNTCLEEAKNKLKKIITYIKNKDIDIIFN